MTTNEPCYGIILSQKLAIDKLMDSSANQPLPDFPIKFLTEYPIRFVRWDHDTVTISVIFPQAELIDAVAFQGMQCSSFRLLLKNGGTDIYDTGVVDKTATPDYILLPEPILTTRIAITMTRTGTNLIQLQNVYYGKSAKFISTSLSISNRKWEVNRTLTGGAAGVSNGKSGKEVTFSGLATDEQIVELDEHENENIPVFMTLIDHTANGGVRSMYAGFGFLSEPSSTMRRQNNHNFKRTLTQFGHALTEYTGTPFSVDFADKVGQALDLYITDYKDWS